MTTTDRSRRRVRVAAISGTVLLGAGAAVAIAADPFPASQPSDNPALAALETREKALAREAKRVDAMNAERWDTYRDQLAERQKEIAAVSAANADARASYSAGSSYSGPQASYVPTAPAASSSSS
jgi:hypothetical protein